MYIFWNAHLRKRYSILDLPFLDKHLYYHCYMNLLIKRIKASHFASAKKTPTPASKPPNDTLAKSTVVANTSAAHAAPSVALHTVPNKLKNHYLGPDANGMKAWLFCMAELSMVKRSGLKVWGSFQKSGFRCTPMIDSCTVVPGQQQHPTHQTYESYSILYCMHFAALI